MGGQASRRSRRLPSQLELAEVWVCGMVMAITAPALGSQTNGGREALDPDEAREVETSLSRPRKGEMGVVSEGR